VPFRRLIIKKNLYILIFIISCFTYQAAIAADPRTSNRSKEVENRKLGSESNPGELRKEVENSGFEIGAPIFIRTIKKSKYSTGSFFGTGFNPGAGVVEVWMKNKAGQFKLFKSYRANNYSGVPGPKKKEGDKQTPEGFYAIKASSFLPKSTYHLAMNVGYPNKHDKQLNRTGSSLMIHGGLKSSGCFAMGDDTIEDIYLLAQEAIKKGQKEISVHMLPFPLTESELERAKDSPNYKFWKNLKEGSDLFEQNKIPPTVRALNGKYTFQMPMNASLGSVNVEDINDSNRLISTPGPRIDETSRTIPKDSDNGSRDQIEVNAGSRVSPE
jgi:murein L,D-transpeptidase YafK